MPHINPNVDPSGSSASDAARLAGSLSQLRHALQPLSARITTYSNVVWGLLKPLVTVGAVLELACIYMKKFMMYAFVHVTQFPASVLPWSPIANRVC